jgi:hypothetical protein
MRCSVLTGDPQSAWLNNAQTYLKIHNLITFENQKLLLLKSSKSKMAKVVGIKGLNFKNLAKKRAPRGRGQSALVLSLCESLVADLFWSLLLWNRWLRRSTLRGGLRGSLLRRTNRRTRIR